jgi:hypothetical protein
MKLDPQLTDALALSDAEEKVVLKALEVPEPWDGERCIYCRSRRWGSHRPECAYANLTLALAELFTLLARPSDGPERPTLVGLSGE